MTPQERQLVDDLFDRLSRVEGAPRDPDALAAIADGQRRAPNALYALVQTVLLQNEALKRAHARIEELEREPAPAQAQPSGFLDSMRDAVFGQGQSRGSVPSVRPGATERPAWNTGQVLSSGAAPYGQQPGGYGQPPGYGQQPAPFGQQGAPQASAAGSGGSFLGTAAAAAAGMVGGSLLLGSIRNMMGGSGSGADKQAFGDNAAASGNESRSPWSSDSSGGNLSKDAGVNDIAAANDRGNDSSGSGLYDQASYNRDDEDPDSYGDDFNDDSDFI